MSCCTITGWSIIGVYVFVIYALSTAEASLYCLSCTDAVKPRDCGEIAICGPHEQCFTDSYVTNFGTIRYNLGCRDAEQCTPRAASLIGRRSVSRLLVCSQCCSDGNVCNNQGCGEKGFGDRALRGPVCANCQTQEYEDDCNKVTVCGRDEMCSLRKLYNTITQETRFKTECMSRSSCLDDVQQLNSLLHSVNIIGRRELVEVDAGGSCVMRCCDDDLCNTNCIDKQALSTSASPTYASTTDNIVHTTVPLTLAASTTATAITFLTLPKSTSAFTPLPTTSTTSTITTTTSASVKPETPPYVFSTSVQTPAQPSVSSATPIPDPCLDNPCAYGTCSPYGNSYRCTCVLGYFGRNCTEIVSIYPPMSTSETAAGSKTTTPSYVITTVQDPKQSTTSSSTTTAATTTRTTVPSPSITPIAMLTLTAASALSTTTSSPPNPCSSNPCMNGMCVLTDNNSFLCKCVAGYGGILCNQKAACHDVHVGDAVTRGPDWSYGEQGTGIGYVTEVTPDGWVKVRWENTVENIYRNGNNGSCEVWPIVGLIITPPATLQTTSTTTAFVDPCAPNPCGNGTCIPLDINQQRVNCKCAVGFIGSKCDQRDFCPQLEIGDSVIKGPDWHFEHQDHGTIGEVVAKPTMGYVMVEWQDNSANYYRYDATGPCDVWPVKVNLVAQDCEAHKRFCDAHCGQGRYYDTPDICIYCICKS